MWIAAAVSENDREAVADGELEGMAEELGYRLHLLDIDPETYSRYYDVVSNRMLWFANHCLWEELGIAEFGDEELKAWDSAYLPVNEAFAKAVLSESEPDDLILFQDYHLTVAPQLVRAERPDQIIFHFTHSSFCAQGYDRVPKAVRKGVIEGLLGADLLGFHVASWVNEFLDCCESLGYAVDRDKSAVEHGDRRTWVKAYPIPIDAPALQELGELGDPFTPGVSAFSTRLPIASWCEPIAPSHPRTSCAASRRSVRCLDRREDLREVTFFACLYSSRQSMPEYRRYLVEIEDAIARVNERHPDSIRMFLKNDYRANAGRAIDLRRVARESDHGRDEPGFERGGGREPS